MPDATTAPPRPRRRLAEGSTPSPTRRRAPGVGAASISPGRGPSADQPLNLATAGIPELLRALGLDDLLGVGEGSLSQAGPGPLTGTKPLHEFLGDVLTPSNPKAGVPKRIRLTSLNPDAQPPKAVTHALDKSFTQMDAAPADLAKLIREGQLIPEGPAELGIPQLLSRLKRVLAQAPKIARR